MGWGSIIKDVVYNQYSRLVPVLFGLMILNYWFLKHLGDMAEVSGEPGILFDVAELGITLIKVGLLVITAMIVVSVSQVNGWAGPAPDPLSGLLKQVLIVLVIALVLNALMPFLEFAIIQPTAQDVDPITFELIPSTSAVPEEFWWAVFLLRIVIFWIFHWAAVGAFANEVATGETRFIANVRAGWKNPFSSVAQILFVGYLLYLGLWVGHFYGEWGPGTLEFTASTLFIFILMFLTCIITLRRIQLLHESG